MKKLLWVSVMVLLMTVPVYAQDSEGGGSGPSPGELLFEITASPFNRDGDGFNSPKLLCVGQFRGRYYLSDMLVPRLGLWYNVNDNNFDNPSPDVVYHMSEFVVAPGIEYHFMNEGGFTSYAALDVLIYNKSARIESTTEPDIFGTTQYEGGQITSNTTNFDFDQRGRFGIGAYAAVGADYHFSSRFYLGVEFGFSFMTGTTSDIEIDGSLYQTGNQYFMSGLNTSNSLRVGFKLF